MYCQVVVFEWIDLEVGGGGGGYCVCLSALRTASARKCPRTALAMALPVSMCVTEF